MCVCIDDENKLIHQYNTRQNDPDCQIVIEISRRALHGIW